jgi:hypothetical protein
VYKMGSSSDPHAFDNLDDLLNADVNFDLSSLAVDSSPDVKPSGSALTGM